MTEQKEEDISTIQFPLIPDETDLDDDATHISGAKAVLWTKRLERDLLMGTFTGKQTVAEDLLTRVQAVSISHKKGKAALKAFLDTVDHNRVETLHLAELTDPWTVATPESTASPESAAILESTVSTVIQCLRSGIRSFGPWKTIPRGWTPAGDWFEGKCHFDICAAD